MNKIVLESEFEREAIGLNSKRKNKSKFKKARGKQKT
jgi:hypothetical protein